MQDISLEKEWAMKIQDKKEDSEWRILKTISHPNFPRIVDAFEENRKNILVMDYIQGVTLEEIIQKGPMDEKQMLHIAKQMCDALLYLHQSSPVLLYLDLKPANIILEEIPHKKIMCYHSNFIMKDRGEKEERLLRRQINREKLEEKRKQKAEKTKYSKAK